MSPIHLSVQKKPLHTTPSINTRHFPSSLTFSRDSLCQRKFFMGRNWSKAIIIFNFCFFHWVKTQTLWCLIFFCCSRFLSQTRQFLLAYVDALLLNLNIYAQVCCRKLITYNGCLLSTAQCVEFMSVTEKCLTSSIMLRTLHGLFFWKSLDVFILLLL